MWSALLCRPDTRRFPTFLPITAALAGRRGLQDHTPTPLLASVPVPDPLLKPRSPALAGGQIPHSQGLGRETLLPDHKDKELFISPLPSNMAFLLSQPLSPSAPPGQRAGIVLITTIISELAHSASQGPRSALPLSPGTMCKSSLAPLLLSWNSKLLSPQIWLGRERQAPHLDGSRIPSLSSPWQTPSSAAITVNSVIVNLGRYLCSWLCWVHYKGNRFAARVLYPFEVFIFSEHKSHWGDMTETSTCSSVAIRLPPHLSTPKTFLMFE